MMIFRLTVRITLSQGHVPDLRKGRLAGCRHLLLPLLGAGGGAAGAAREGAADGLPQAQAAHQGGPLLLMRRCVKNH
jgi:hypothetical protein